MMKIFTSTMIYLAVSILCVYTIRSFFENILGEKKYPAYYYALGYTALAGAIFTAHSIDNGFLVQVVMTTACIASVTILYSSGSRRRILAVALAAVTAILSEVGAVLLLYAINGNELRQYFLDDNLKYLLALCTQLLYFMLLKIIGGFMKKKNGTKLPYLYWLMTCFIPLLSIFALNMVFSSHADASQAQVSFMEIIVVASMIVFHLSAFYYYEKILNGDGDKMQNALLDRQLQYYAKQIEEIKNMQKEVNMVLKNIEKQLSQFEEYLEKRKDDHSATYLKNLIHKVEALKGTKYSSNALIDSILYQKIAKAEDDKIAVDLHLQIPSELQVKADLCVILGNALDNAIEACSRLEQNKRTISVNINYDHEALYIEITNPYDGELRYDLRGDLLSTKADKKYSGFGVKNIKQLVERNADFMTIKAEDHIFKLQILLSGKAAVACE